MFPLLYDCAESQLVFIRLELHDAFDALYYPVRAQTTSQHPHRTRPAARGRRYWVRRDGKNSAKMPEATPSPIAEHIRRWLAANSWPSWAVPKYGLLMVLANNQNNF